MPHETALSAVGVAGPWLALLRPQSAGRAASRSSCPSPRHRAHHFQSAHNRVPHLLRHRTLVGVACTADQLLIGVNSDLEAVADITPRPEHDLLCVLDLFAVLRFK